MERTLANFVRCLEKRGDVCYNNARESDTDGEETEGCAHANGILCNVFWSDEPEEAIRYREMGVDCILTNDYLSIKNALEEHFSEKA